MRASKNLLVLATPAIALIFATIFSGCSMPCHEGGCSLLGGGAGVGQMLPPPAQIFPQRDCGCSTFQRCDRCRLIPSASSLLSRIRSSQSLNDAAGSCDSCDSCSTCSGEFVDDQVGGCQTCLGSGQIGGGLLSGRVFGRHRCGGCSGKRFSLRNRIQGLNTVEESCSDCGCEGAIETFEAAPSKEPVIEEKSSAPSEVVPAEVAPEEVAPDEKPARPFEGVGGPPPSYSDVDKGDSFQDANIKPHDYYTPSRDLSEPKATAEIQPTPQPQVPSQPVSESKTTPTIDEETREKALKETLPFSTILDRESISPETETPEPTEADVEATEPDAETKEDIPETDTEVETSVETIEEKELPLESQEQSLIPDSATEKVSDAKDDILVLKARPTSWSVLPKTRLHRQVTQATPVAFRQTTERPSSPVMGLPRQLHVHPLPAIQQPIRQVQPELRPLPPTDEADTDIEPTPEPLPTVDYSPQFEQLQNRIAELEDLLKERLELEQSILFQNELLMLQNLQRTQADRATTQSQSVETNSIENPIRSTDPQPIVEDAPVAALPKPAASHQELADQEPILRLRAVQRIEDSNLPPIVNIKHTARPHKYQFQLPSSQKPINDTSPLNGDQNLRDSIDSAPEVDVDKESIEGIRGITDRSSENNGSNDLIIER